jgi:hypothetical protein
MAPGLKLIDRARPVFDGGLLKLTFTVPTLAVKGDLLVVLVVRNQAVVAPEGWTLIENGLGGAALFLDAWARLVDNNEPKTAVFTTAVGQELQGQLLLLLPGSPSAVREASATGTFTADVTPDTPASTTVQAINLIVCIHSCSTAIALTAPAGFTTIDTYNTAIIAARSILLSYKIAKATGALAPGPAGASAAATGRAWTLILRDRGPITPVELVDPVPGNIGLLG